MSNNGSDPVFASAGRFDFTVRPKTTTSRSRGRSAARTSTGCGASSPSGRAATGPRNPPSRGCNGGTG